MSKSHRELIKYDPQHTNRNETLRYDRDQKRKSSSRCLRYLTTTAHSTAAGATLRGWCQGSIPGVLLELNELATLTRVDSKDHALLTVASLATVEPHRVRVLHSELCPGEGLLVFSHWHAERKNQSKLELDATEDERLTSQCRIRQQGANKGYQVWTVLLCGSFA